MIGRAPADSRATRRLATEVMMIRHRLLLVRSPLVLALAVAACQPVNKPAETGDEPEGESAGEVLIRSIPDAEAGTLVFPPPVSARHARADLVLDDGEQTLGLGKELKVRSPYLGSGGSFDFRGRTFRVVFTHEIELPRKASTKRPVPAADGVVTIEPAVAFKAVWTAGNVLEVTAEDHYDPDQTYTATIKGLKSTEGLELSEPWKHDFTADIAFESAGKSLSYIPKPGEARVIAVHPLYGDKVGKRENLAVVFDQALTLEEAARQIRLTNGDGERPVKLSHSRGKRFQGVDVDPKQVVLVRPVRPLVEGEELTFEAWDFDQSAGSGHSRSFMVAQPLELADVSCGYSYNSESCEWKEPHLRTSSRDIWLNFNNALAEKDGAAKGKVSVSPAVNNLSVWVTNGWDGDGQLRISGDFKPSRTYSVTVQSLSDRFGSSTGGPITFDVETAPLPSSATIAEGVLILDEEHSREFVVTTRNVLRGELHFWAVADGDADAFKQARSQVDSRTLPSGAPEVVIPFSPVGPRDEFIKTGVDLLSKLRPGKNYVATVSIAESAHQAQPIKHPSWSSASRPPVVLVTPGDARSLAVHTHSLADATVLHVARLGSGEPVVGASVRVNGELVRGRTTDDKGVVVLPIGVDKARASVISVDDGAGNQAQVALSSEGSRERSYFPDLTSSATLRMDDRRAMVITDRGIYRPGSTVFIKGSVRKRQGGELVPIPSLPVKIRVLGPMEDEVQTINAVTNDMGSVAGQFDATDKARLGEYQIRIEEAIASGADNSEGGQDGLLAATFVKIAEFEAPRFTVDVEAKTPKAGSIAAKIVGRYLFGAAMDGADLEWTLSRASAELPSGPFTDGGFAFDARRSWYWWDDDDREERWSRADRAKLGEDGTFTVRQELDLGKAVAPQRFTLEADVTDTSYRHVAGRDSVVVHPFERYVGVKLPRPWTSANGPVEVALGVIGQDGKPVAGAEVTAHLERMQWRYTKTRSSGGYTSYDWHVERSEVDSCTATSATQAVTCTLTPPRGGEYVVITEVDGHRGGEASFWAWGGDGDEVVFPSRGRTVDIVADKARYAPGEKASLMVRSPFPKATAILTLEQGGLLTHQSVVMDGNTHLFEVPITAAHAPQLHAVVTLLPIDAPAESKAEWKIGAIRLPVSLADASLGVALRSDRESYEPGEKATITVEVKDGKRPREGAEIALAVVDEGILRLTNFHAADPVKALRPGMPLRFEVADSRNALATLLGLSQSAGDGMAGDEAANARKNFLETALWKPDLRTDASGKAEVSFTLPDNLTRFRMMAVVLDQKGKGGNAESSFTVRRPLMMIPAIPRFAAVGDTFEAAAMVHNNEETAQRAKVSLGGEVREIELAASGRQRIAFPITADKAGDLQLDFALRDGGGKTHDAVQVKVPVDAPGVAERPVLDGAFVGSQRIDVKVPDSAMVGKETDDYVAVKVGQHLWPELGARLEFLLGYPHGCVEQTTSGLLPLLAAREILPRIGFTKLTPPELDKRIKAGIDRLATMKTYSGGLGYWPGDSSPNVYGTAYAIRALITAKKAGIELPSGLLEGMSEYLDDQLFSASEPEVQAAIAQSLAEQGLLPASSLDALFDRKDRQGVFGLASLAIAFGTFADQDERTRELLDLVEASFDEKGDLTRDVKPDDFYYYGSPTRSKAQAAIALGRLRKTSKVYHKLLKELSNISSSYTTQPVAFSLLALSEQLSKISAEGAEFLATLDGKPLTSVVDLGAGSFEYRIPLADLRGREAKLELSSTSKAAIAFMVSSHWKRSLDDAATLSGTSADNGPELYRVITDGEGNAVDLANVAPGQVLRVSLLAKLPVGKHEYGRMNYLAVTDRLPAGFEAVQTDLWTVARAPEITDKHPFYNRLRWGGSDASFIEMHDERVNVYFDRVWGDEVVATYLVRALTPGSYAHPPAEAEFMYIPDSTSYSEAGKVVVK
ncbi:MAG: hypothetical protein H6711_20885 [Myxococcales bacterium]|nr:hypothetical protein [Myxococcales bacterium]